MHSPHNSMHSPHTSMHSPHISMRSHSFCMHSLHISMQSLSTGMQTQQRMSQNMSVSPPPKRTQSVAGPSSLPETGVLRSGGRFAAQPMGSCRQTYLVAHGMCVVSFSPQVRVTVDCTPQTVSSILVLLVVEVYTTRSDLDCQFPGLSLLNRYSVFSIICCLL